MSDTPPENNINAFDMSSLFNPWTDELKNLSTTMRTEAATVGKDNPLLPPADEAVICVLDGGYGSGKSVLVHQWYQGLKKEDPNAAVFMNAWTSDHSDNPMMDILNALLPAPSPNLITWWNIKKLVKKLITNTSLTIGPKKMLSLTVQAPQLEEDSPLIQLHCTLCALPTGIIPSWVNLLTTEAQGYYLASKLAKKRSDDSLLFLMYMILKDSAYLDVYLNHIKEEFAKIPPLFIFIDELDRAKPTYALALLESVKHLFNIPNVIFVLVMNKDHLAQTVCSSYGYREVSDGHKYLERFYIKSYLMSREVFDRSSLKGSNNISHGWSPYDSIQKTIPGWDDLALEYELSQRDLFKIKTHIDANPKLNAYPLWSIWLLMVRQTRPDLIKKIRTTHPNPPDNHELDDYCKNVLSAIIPIQNDHPLAKTLSHDNKHISSNTHLLTMLANHIAHIIYNHPYPE